MGTANGALPKTYLTNKGPTMKNALSLFALIAAFPAVAEETRQLDAHEHGVGQLNIAFDGQQIAMELDYVGQRTNMLYSQLKNEQKSDQWQMGVGMLLFWPVLLALEGGDGPNTAQYSQLKGEYEAIRSSWVTQQCKRGTGQASTNKPSGIDRMCLAMDQGKNDLTLPESSECPTGYYDTLSGTAR